MREELGIPRYLARRITKSMRRIHTSMISNGVSVHIFQAPEKVAAMLRRGQLVRIRGGIQEMFYGTGVAIHMEDGAQLEGLE